MPSLSALYEITDAIGPDGVPVTVGIEPVGCCALTLFVPKGVYSKDSKKNIAKNNPAHFMNLNFICLQSTKK